MQNGAVAVIPTDTLYGFAVSFNSKEAVEKEINQLQRTLDMLKFKCWYYETAIADGSEDRIHEMLPNNLPPDIQKLYDNTHR